MQTELPPNIISKSWGMNNDQNFNLLLGHFFCMEELTGKYPFCKINIKDVKSKGGDHMATLTGLRHVNFHLEITGFKMCDNFLRCTDDVAQIT